MSRHYSRTSVVGCLVAFAFWVPGFLGQARAADEDDVKGAFKALQTALQAREANKIWDVLDKPSQTAADKVAKAFKASYEKSGTEKKAEVEKALGLNAAEMKDLTGQTYLKSKRFVGRYGEVPGSKIASVTVDKDKAVVNYIEDDGDKEKLIFMRQDGKWKAALRIP